MSCSKRIYCWRLLLTTILVVITGECIEYNNDDTNQIERTTSQLARSRGFQAIDHSVVTDDGYILNVVQVFSPLVDRAKIASKPPVLFIHGFLNNANTWIVHSLGAKPQDYSAICPDATEEQLLKMAENDPGFNSITITFMNCGREVWLLNRRGSMQSLGHIGRDKQPYLNPMSTIMQTFFKSFPFLCELLSGFSYLLPSFGGGSAFKDVAHHYDKPFNPRYWNYSLDEEAKNDVHSVIKYVLQQTGKPKLTIVAHSSGAAITLAAQVLEPELANKIDRTLMYAPAMYLFHSEAMLFAPLVGFAVSYLGSFTPQFMMFKIRYLVKTVCRLKLARGTICSLILQGLAGPDGFSEPLLPVYAEGFIDITSSHELAHLVQSALRGKMHHFDYLNPIRNLIAYGQPDPPLYNVTEIPPQKMAIWFGNSDTMIPVSGIHKLAQDLRSSVEMHHIDKPGLLWSHFSYFFEENQIPSCVTVPSVIFLESAGVHEHNAESAKPR